ncbi:acyl-CoA dehydrogenase family protein, partial [Streptomyces sp. NPDC002130]
MNLELTGEEVAFREEMRKFFTTEFSPELRARAAGFGKLTREDIVSGQQILNAHGLAVPHWPVEWGGKDWTPVQRHIYSEEMQLASVPNPLPFNVSMV